MVSFSKHLQNTHHDVWKIIFSFLKYREIIYLACSDRWFAHLVKQISGIRWVPLKPAYTPYPHQLDTMHWMLHREANVHRGIVGGIVGLDMGLGKTLTAIMHCLTVYKKTQRPTLIVTSKTILTEWIQTFDKFFDRNIKILVITSDAKGIYNISGVHFVLVTYDTVKSIWSKYLSEDCSHNVERDNAGRIVKIDIAKYPATLSHSVTDTRKIIFTTKWQRLVTDESQLFTNSATIVYKSVMAICATYRWCLTGTPVKNKETDMFSLMRFIGYDTLDKSKWWNLDLFKQHQLSKAIKFMTYEVAGIQLPEKHVRERTIVLTGNEQKSYLAFENRTKHVFEQMMLGNVNFANVLGLFIRLRQICIASHLITLGEKKKKKGKKALLEIEKNNYESTSSQSLSVWLKDKHNTSGFGSAKIKEVIKIVNNIPKDKKIIIFSTFATALTLVEEALIDNNLEDRENRYEIARVDGSVLGEKRDSQLDLFKNNKKYKVLLMTYKTGSEGLNLTVANHVICLEPWWTPTVEKQALARVWRNGQTQPVYLYRLIIANSIESNMIKMICDTKDQIAKSYLEESEIKLNPKSQGLNKELMGKILYGKM